MNTQILSDPARTTLSAASPGVRRSRSPALSSWIFPLTAALLALALLASLPGLFSRVGPQAPLPASFSAFVDARHKATPAQVFRELQQAPQQFRLAAFFPDEDYWLQFAIPQAYARGTSVLELDARDISRIRCLDDSGRTLGSATRSERHGQMQVMREGFALGLPPHASTVTCQLNFIGPVRFKAGLWDSFEARQAHLKFQNVGGLIDGGMIALAFFACIAAWFTQSMTPLLYGAWLIVNARLASLSAGLDFSWMTWQIPAPWLHWLRTGEVASYIILSMALLPLMFKTDIRRLGLWRPLRSAVAWLTATVTILYFLPFVWAIRALWLAACLSGLLLLYVMFRVVMARPSLSSVICSIGWLLSLAAQFTEIVSAVVGVEPASWVASSVGASAATVLLVAAAIAMQIKHDRIERSRQRHDAMQALQIVRRTYQNVPLGLFTVGPTGLILRTNPGFTRMLGLSPSGRKLTWPQCFPETTMTDVLSQAGKDGTLIHRDQKIFRLGAVPVRDSFECTLADVTEETRNTERLRHLVDHDALTGTLNRRGLSAWADHAHRDRRWGRSLSFAYLNLHSFKLINDLFGYQTGDAVLQQTAERIRAQIFGDKVTLVRLGSDQFLMIFEDWSEIDIRACSANIVSAICEQRYDIQDKRIAVTAAVGIINVDPSLTLAEALAAAGNACTLAGRFNERIHWTVANPRQIKSYRAEQKLARSFEEQLPVERFFLQFQPIVSLTMPSASLAAEVLIRMHSEDGGIVSPRRFLPIAERQGLMSQIDWWVLSSTVAWFAQHPESIMSFNDIAINLSETSLNDSSFLDKVVEHLQEHRWLPGKLVFEINEAVALRNTAITNQFVDRMKSLGVRIGLDDFGAGYTSFSYLQAFPADTLKLDGHFVRDAARNLQNHRIIRAITDLAHQLGMTCIAEWAESVALIRTLHELGADHAQGWGLRKAIDPRHFIGVSSSLQLVENVAARDYLIQLEQNSPHTASFAAANRR